MLPIGGDDGPSDTDRAESDWNEMHTHTWVRASSPNQYLNSMLKYECLAHVRVTVRSVVRIYIYMYVWWWSAYTTQSIRHMHECMYALGDMMMLHMHAMPCQNEAHAYTHMHARWGDMTLTVSHLLNSIFREYDISQGKLLACQHVRRLIRRFVLVHVCIVCLVSLSCVAPSHSVAGICPVHALLLLAVAYWLTRSYYIHIIHFFMWYISYEAILNIYDLKAESRIMNLSFFVSIRRRRIVFVCVCLCGCRCWWKTWVAGAVHGHNIMLDESSGRCECARGL